MPLALAAVRKGGTVVCGGIHMSDIPSFPYRLLWEERVVRSVANLTRQDAIEFLAFAAQAPDPHRGDAPTRWPRPTARWPTCAHGRLQGAAVLIP